MDISFNTAFAQEIFDDLEARDSRNFELLVQVADAVGTSTDTDIATMRIQVGELFLDREIDGVVTFSEKFVEHYADDTSDAVAALEVLKEDEVVSSVLITLDKTIATDARLREMRYNLEAVTTGKSFPLESFVFTFDDSNLISASRS